MASPRQKRLRARSERISRTTRQVIRPTRAEAADLRRGLPKFRSRAITNRETYDDHIAPMKFAPLRAVDGLAPEQQTRIAAKNRQDDKKHGVIQAPTCKKRPDSKKPSGRGAGKSRDFVPWCK